MLGAAKEGGRRVFMTDCDILVSIDCLPNSSQYSYMYMCMAVGMSI